MVSEIRLSAATVVLDIWGRRDVIGDGISWRDVMDNLGIDIILAST